MSFEHKYESEFARERIGKFIKRFDIEYGVLFAGKSDKRQSMEHF